MYEIKVKSLENAISVKHVTTTIDIKTSGRGATGATGPQGTPGEGVPVGGTTGQVLSKDSDDNYDTEWVDIPSAPVQSVNGRTGAVTGLAEDNTVVHLAGEETITGQKDIRGRFDFLSDSFDITNPSMRFIQEDSSSTDDHAKGLLLEWGGNMVSGVNYPYGIATNAYQTNPSSTFTVPSTGYKKWGWIMTHYQSPSSTGETVHQHLNLETVKADYQTVITRLQVSFGEDTALVSFPNSNVKVFNDLNFQIGTNDNGLYIKHDTALNRVIYSGNTPWNITGTGGVRLGSVGNPAARLHVERSDDATMLLLRSTLATANGAAMLAIENPAAGATAIQSGLTAESTKRYSMNTSGRMEWGSGSTTRDTNLYRNAANELKTDDKFVAVLGVDSGSQRGTNFATPTASTDAANKSYVDSAISGLPAAPVTSVFSRTGAVTAQSGDYTASLVTNVPTGNISATTVQAALNELDTDKANASDLTAYVLKAGDTMTGTLTTSGAFVASGNYTAATTTPGVYIGIPTGLNPRFTIANASGQTIALDNNNGTFRFINSIAGVVMASLNANSLSAGSNLTASLGTSSAYWLNTYSQRYYLNSTAYLDGTTAGTVDLTGILNVTGAINSAQLNVLAAVGTINVTSASANNFSSGLAARKRGTTGDANAAVASGAEIGYHTFMAWDGSAYKRLAYVIVRASAAITPSAGGGIYEIITRDNSNTESVKVKIDNNGLYSGSNLSYSLGIPSNYWINIYAQRHYFNSTAYIDGSSAGNLEVTGRLATTASLVAGTTMRTNTGLVRDSNGSEAAYYTGANGPIIERDIADANPGAVINNAHASSTGDILQLRSNSTTVSSFNKAGVFFPVKAPTSSAPPYVLGGVYFDTTLNKLRIGGAAGWETVTSS